MKPTLLKYVIDSSHQRARGLCTRHLARMGRNVVTRWRVDIHFNERKASPGATIGDWLNDTTQTLAVIAPNARAACDYARNLTRGIPCVEIEVFGPRGGVAAHSFRGWESAIGEQLFDSRPNAEQLTLI